MSGCISALCCSCRDFQAACCSSDSPRYSVIRWRWLSSPRPCRAGLCGPAVTRTTPVTRTPAASAATLKILFFIIGSPRPPATLDWRAAEEVEKPNSAGRTRTPAEPRIRGQGGRYCHEKARLPPDEAPSVTSKVTDGGMPLGGIAAGGEPRRSSCLGSARRSAAQRPAERGTSRTRPSRCSLRCGRGGHRPPDRRTPTLPRRLVACSRDHLLGRALRRPS